jgi:5'-3' exonuclease
MILVDLSSIVHRKLHTSIANLKPNKVDGQYVTADFIGLTKHYIFEDLFAIQNEFSSNFGDLVICVDNASTGYWRKSVYPAYKANRKKSREKSEVNFKEVFEHVDEVIEQIRNNLPWKVIDIPTAEADDIMLVLAKEYSQFEKILIHSPDKDMIQAQRDTDNVFQYSALTKKWLVPENKHDHMEHWIMEHVCLGDTSDNVPKVVDHTEFSPSFLKYIKDEGYNIKNPMEFKSAAIDNNIKRGLIENFDIFKTNRKGESTDVKDIYKDIKFGPATLTKKIAEYGSIDAWLDSHPLYREHFDRNYTLVMAEGIPTDIWNQIVIAFKQSNSDYNSNSFEQYLNENSLQSLLMELPRQFVGNKELTAEDFGW